MFRTMVIALAALMLAGALTGWSGLSAAVPNPIAPDLTVNISPVIQQATVDEVTGCGLNFTGTVKVDMPPVERIVVELSAVVDTGWPASVSPYELVITDSTDHSFYVTVTVIEAASADDPGHLAVIASSSGKGYFVSEQANATINVNPYYRVALESDQPYDEVEPDQGGSFEVTVTNMGNAVDSYEFEIANLDELKDMGWIVELDKTSVSRLRPGDGADVTVTARPPQTWSWDIWISRPVPITVKATSLGAQQGGTVISQDYAVFIHQRGFNAPVVNLISGTTVALVALAIVGIIILRRRRTKRRKAQAADEPASRQAGEPEDR